MTVYATKAFWLGTAERSIKTFAQALLAVIGTGALGVLDIDWVGALSVAAVAALASLLTSISAPDFTAGAPAAEPSPEPSRYDDDYPDPPYMVS